MENLTQRFLHILYSKNYSSRINTSGKALSTLTRIRFTLHWRQEMELPKHEIRTWNKKKATFHYEIGRYIPLAITYNYDIIKFRQILEFSDAYSRRGEDGLLFAN